MWFLTNSQLGWFEQMVRTMGWPFSKEETPKANSIEQRIFEAEQKLRNEVEAERKFRSLRGCWADDPEDADSMKDFSPMPGVKAENWLERPNE